MTGDLDCDRVFDVLTRGPFPAGGDDDLRVERHLSVCHECRELAEALRPAVGLFHEALEYDASRTLPAYQGAIAAAAGQSRGMGPTTVVEDESPTVQADSKQIRFLPSLHDNISQFVAIPVIAVAVSAMLWSPLRRAFTDKLAADGVSPTAAAAAFYPDDEGLRLLRSLSLPLACFGFTSAGSGAESEGSTAGSSARAARQYLCCTQCHAAANPLRPPIGQIAAVVGACRGCHR